MTEPKDPKRLPVPTSAAIEVAGFAGTTFQGAQTFSLEQSEHELGAEDAAASPSR